MDLSNKTFLITGGSGGLGAAQAELLAAAGASVAICDVAASNAEAVIAKINKSGGDARYWPLDVTDESNWKSVVAEIVAWRGRLSGLVNTAGVVNRTGTMGTSLENWNRVLNVNLTGAYLGTRFCADAIRDAGGGAIVNIASVAAHVGHNDPAYSASKAGLLGYTRSAAVEFAKWNIRVNAICPGIIVTGLNNGGEHLKPWQRSTPLARSGAVSDAAYLVRFLLSDEAAFITGEDIALDGGLLAGGVTHRIAEDCGMDLTASNN